MNYLQEIVHRNWHEGNRWSRNTGQILASSKHIENQEAQGDASKNILRRNFQKLTWLSCRWHRQFGKDWLLLQIPKKDSWGLMYKDLRGFHTETWRTLKPKCPPTSDVSMCAHAWIQAYFFCTSQSTWNWAHMSEYPTPPCPRPYLNM